MPRLPTLLLLAALLALPLARFARGDDPDPEPPRKTLEGILKAHPNDRDAVEKLFLHLLKRKPSAEEAARSAAYMRDAARKSGRLLAFKDVEWALVNSKEYIDKQKSRAKGGPSK